MKKHLEIIIAIAVFIMLLPIGLQVKAQDHRADSLRTLSEAGVTVYRPVAKLKDGAMVTTVENTPLAKAGTAEDVLKQVPGLMQKGDKEGTIEVIGKGTPIFYINGRQVRDLSELKQLSSEEVKHVEVIQTPGAKYDANVAAVVRIRTVRRKGEGWGVDAMQEYRQGRYANDNSRLKVNYRRKGLDIFAVAGINGGRYFWNSPSDQLTVTPDTLWYLPMGQNMKGKQLYADYTAGFNFDVDENHSFGLRYQAKQTLKSTGYFSLDSRILANGEYYDQLLSQGEEDNDADLQHDLNLYYVGKLGKGELSVDLSLYANGDNKTNVTNETSQEHDDRYVPSVSRTRNRLWAAKVAYEWPWLGGKVSLGTQYQLTNRHDDYYIPLNNFGLQATNTKQEEKNVAGFVQWSTVLARRYQLSAGLRYEHAAYDYSTEGVHNPDLSPTYNNLFPSLSLATAFGQGAKALQLMFSYTAKTQRPQYGQLSNKVTYGNRFLMQSGNPDLKPTIIHSVNLTLVRGSWQAVAMMDHYQDGILFWGRSLPDHPSITKISFLNKSFTQLQGILTYAPRFKYWQPRFTAVYTQTFCELPVMNGTRKFNNPLFHLATVQVFKLPARIDLTAVYSFQTKGNYQNVKVDKLMHYTELYASRSFLNDALTVTLGCQDLLHNVGSRNLIFMENSRFLQSGEGDTRQVYLKLHYKFNAMRDKYRGKSAVEEIIKRL